MNREGGGEFVMLAEVREYLGFRFLKCIEIRRSKKSSLEQQRESNKVKPNKEKETGLKNKVL